jgi:hypothetical protein
MRIRIAKSVKVVAKKMSLFLRKVGLLLLLVLILDRA